LMDVIDRKTTLADAFKIVDSVLAQGVQGISEIITTPGLINVDFADVRTIMKEAGSALLGIGTGIGENRAQMAARAAISSSLLELSIEGAKGVLFNISGGQDMTMAEVDEAARIISETADADANIIFGATINEKLSDQMRITVVATGFDEMRSRLGKMVRPLLVKPKLDKEGLVGEVKKEEVKQQIEDEDGPADNNGGRDEWGEKFEVPAFLRQGRN